MSARPFGWINCPLFPWTVLVSQKMVSLSPGQQQPAWQSFSCSRPSLFSRAVLCSSFHQGGASCRCLTHFNWPQTYELCTVGGQSYLFYLWWRYQVLPLDRCLRDCAIAVDKENYGTEKVKGTLSKAIWAICRRNWYKSGTAGSLPCGFIPKWSFLLSLYNTCLALSCPSSLCHVSALCSQNFHHFTAWLKISLCCWVHIFLLWFVHCS